MTTLEAKMAALEIGFIELAKFIGRADVFQIRQLPTAMNDSAKASKASAEIVVAVAELGAKFR